MAISCCVLSLTSCGQDIAKESAEKGRNYFDSGDYETAAKAFGVSIDNGNTEDEIQLLYDITLKYHQAKTAFEEKRYATSMEIIESIDTRYSNYGIKDSIVNLKDDINNILEAEELLNDIAQKISESDYVGAIALIEMTDVSSLTSEQAEQLEEYKNTITEAQAEIARQAEEQRRAEEEAERREAERRATSSNNSRPSQNTNTNNRNQNNSNTPQTPVAPAINTNVSGDAYIYPTDTTLLTAAQLSTLNASELALLRNEIYARKGHIFTTNRYIPCFACKI